MKLLEKTNEEILEIANPIWDNLVKSSNVKDYSGFTKDFSAQMLYGANEVEIGYKKKFEIIITEPMLSDFAKLSGDYNPLHMNEEYATSTSFKKRVCSGMFLPTFFSR